MVRSSVSMPTFRLPVERQPIVLMARGVDAQQTTGLCYRTGAHGCGQAQTGGRRTNLCHCSVLQVGAILQAGDEDGWDEALGYLDACGPGWHLQIARTKSEDFNLSSSSLLSTGSGLSTVLLGDSARNERPLAERAERGPGELGEATKGIVQARGLSVTC